MSSKHKPKFSREFQRHRWLPEEEAQRQYLEWLITEAAQGRNHRPQLLEQALNQQQQHRDTIMKAVR